jgi:hypothetical protein
MIQLFDYNIHIPGIYNHNFINFINYYLIIKKKKNKKDI